jgi:superfamily I DNA/RNA helicase
VARTIEDLMGGTGFFSAGEQQSGIRSFADIAVLCRVSRQMEPLARALAAHAIPCQAATDQPWLRQEPARSILRILQALRAPGNTLARERVLGDRLATAEDLLRWRRDFERDGDLSSLLSSLAAAFRRRRSRPPSWPGRAGRLRSRRASTVLGACQHEPDVWSGGEQSLLTLRCQGLEFPACSSPARDGLPFTPPARRPADPEEERRLFYVGLTRAGAYLYLSHARRRFLFGRELRLPPSPFLAGLDEELAERLQPDPPAPPREPTAEQLDLF